MNSSPALRTPLVSRFLGSWFLLPALTLAACGYTPLYAPGAGATSAAARVQIGTVEMTQASHNVGQRRTAQTVSQQLQLDFPNSGGDMDSLMVEITETTSTLAVQRTAAIQRAEITLEGAILLTDINGNKLLETKLTTSAPYNVEDTPYSTESGKTYARLTAARNLADEISRRLYLYYSTHKKPEPKPKKPAKPTK